MKPTKRKKKKVAPITSAGQVLLQLVELHSLVKVNMGLTFAATGIRTSRLVLHENRPDLGLLMLLDYVLQLQSITMTVTCTKGCVELEFSF